MHSSSSTKVPLLVGHQYECLILEPAGHIGRFRRVGYICFAPEYFEWSRMAFQDREHRLLEARDAMYEQFIHDDVPDTVCGPPDDENMYTVTLV